MSNEIKIIEQQFEEIRNVILLHRSRALQNVNEESLLTSWQVGQIVSHRLQNNEWGSKVVIQLSEYLRTKDPSLKGYSRRNIYNMVKFYEAYSSPEFAELVQGLSLPQIVQTTSAQPNIIVQPKTAPIGDVIVQTESAQLPKILCLTTFSNHIEILNRCKTREQQIFYILYSHKERLNYKELQRCIKNDTFGSFMGDKTNFSSGIKTVYPQSVALFKDRAFVDFLNLPQKHSNENPSIGILLCQSADHSVVEYAMSRSMSSTMVAEYHRQLIPKEVMQKSLDEFCAFLFDKNNLPSNK